MIDTRIHLNGWTETTLGEVVETNTTSINKSFNFDEILYLDTGSITEGKIESLQKFNLSEAPSRAKRLVKDQDIVYSTVRPIQKHFGFIKNPEKNLVVSTGFTVISAKKEKSDPHFIYYFLTQNQITNVLQQIAEHSVSTYPSIKPENIEQLKLFLPKLPEQRAIAAVLSSFDNKIDLLHQQNQTLEATAQAIFKEWFVDFRFPGAGEMMESELGMIPEGWKVDSLSNIAKFLNGLALQKYPPNENEDFLPVIKIKELKNGINENTDKANKNVPSEYIVRNGDVLFSWSGSLELVIWKYGLGALNQHLFKVSSKEFPKWFYFFWIKMHLPNFRQIANSKATTMGHIQRYHLDDAKVTIPDPKSLQKGSNIISPIIDKIITNNNQIQSLTELRDTLLPKLMSGEVRVN